MKKQTRARGPVQASPAPRIAPDASLVPLVDMLMAPSTSPAVRTPSQSPFTGAVRTFVDTFEITSTEDDSHFSLVAHPTLEHTLSVNLSSDVVSIPDVWAFMPTRNIVSFYEYTGGFIVEQETAICDAGNTGHAMRAVGEAPMARASDNLPYFPCVFDALAKIIVRVNIVGTGGIQPTKCFLYSHSAAKDWSSLGTFSPEVNLDVTLAADGCDGLRFVTNGTCNCEFVIQPKDATVHAALPSDTSHDLFTLQSTELAHLSEYRVTSLSLLASYAGDEFSDGGVIAAARTRPNFSMQASNAYEALTRLQDHVYRGPLKLGAYTWWLPNSIEELDFRARNESPPTTDLRIAGTLAKKSATLQITVSMVVEFYSPLQIFEHLPGVPMDDNYQLLIHYLNTVPAATCNPGHLDNLKKTLQSIAKSGSHHVKRGVSRGVDYLIAHPELLAKALASVATVLI